MNGALVPAVVLREAKREDQSEQVIYVSKLSAYAA